jgi:hypothetical protein
MGKQRGRRGAQQQRGRRGAQQQRGGRAGGFGKDIGFLARCKSAGGRRAFLRGSGKAKGLQKVIRRGCAQVLQRGGKLSPAIRRRLARHRGKILRGARSQRGAGQILQSGGSFLGDLWKGVTHLLGIN